MFFHFCRYFFSYIIFAKSRQRLLFLALIGLFLSSFALLVLQSTMGGLQHKLITRSKNIVGDVILYLDKMNAKDKELLVKDISIQKFPYSYEFELEALLKNGPYLVPTVIHGIGKKSRPAFLKNVKLDEIILPNDLSYKLRLSSHQKLQLISPAHTDSFMGDIPRSITLYHEDYLQTDVPEIDSFHAWVSLPKIQNLVGEKTINRVRIYAPVKKKILDELKTKYQDLSLKTWEELNSTLVYALSLETTIMVFLFIAMTFLVSLCITSGLLIFQSKIKVDLMSFWILGLSQESIRKYNWFFIVSMTLAAILGGLTCALIFLELFDHYGVELLPDIFVDRKIPIYVTMKGLVLSFSIPLLMSLLFSWASFRAGKDEDDYLRLLKN
jgi:lipoprotein-releasing system permease protein